MGIVHFQKILLLVPKVQEGRKEVRENGRLRWPSKLVYFMVMGSTRGHWERAVQCLINMSVSPYVLVLAGSGVTHVR